MIENYCNTCPSGIRGLCCHYSMYDGIEHVITDKCPYLTKAGRCSIYDKRFDKNPKCLTVDKALRTGALPEECAYVKNSDIIPDKPYKKRVIKNEYKKRRFNKNP